MQDARNELRIVLNAFLQKYPDKKLELARHLSVSIPTINRWATGKSAPHPIGCQPAIQAIQEFEEELKKTSEIFHSG